MTRADLTEKLLDIKREKGWTQKYIWEQIGGMSPVLVTAETSIPEFGLIVFGRKNQHFFCSGNQPHTV